MHDRIPSRWLWVMALTVAAITVRPVPAIAAAEPDRGAAGQLLTYINGDRLAAGLAPLSVSSVAVEVAEAWSQHMADIGDLAHNDEWFTAESRQRAGAAAVGENVATNVDLADAHRRLMNSPGHRANILDARFHQVGIGVVRGPSGAWWITEDFLQVKSAPTVLAPAPPPMADPTNPRPAPAPDPVPASPPPRSPAPAPPAAVEPQPAPAPTPTPPRAPEAPAEVAVPPSATTEAPTAPPSPDGPNELAAGPLVPTEVSDDAVLASAAGAATLAVALAALIGTTVKLVRLRRRMAGS